MLRARSFNQLKMGTFLSYVSIGIQNLTAMIYTPVMLRLLGQDQYGLYQLSNSTVAYLGLLTFGFGSSYVKFYYDYRVQNDEEGIRKLNSIFLLVFLAMSVLCVIAGAGMVLSADFLFGGSLTPGEIQEVRILMVVLIITMALTFPNIIFDCYITAHERYIFQRMLLIMVNVLNPFIGLPLLLMGYRSMSLVMANLILLLLRVGLNVYYCVRKLHMKFQFKGMERGVLKRVGTFSFYVFLNEVANQINWNIDKMVLGAFQGAGIVALYSVGSQFNQYFINMSTAVSNVFIPRVNKMIAEGQGDDKLTELFVKIGRIQYIILGAVLTGYLLYGKFFIIKWAGQEYEGSYLIGAVIMLPTMIPLIQNIGIEIQKAKNKHKFRSVTYFLIALANLIVSIPLAIRFGALGSAAGTALATVAGNVLLMNWYYDRHVGLDIYVFFRSMLRPTAALLIAAAVGLCVRLFIPVDSWPAFIGEAVLFLGVYLLCLWYFGFSSDEKEQAERILANFKIKREEKNGADL